MPCHRRFFRLNSSTAKPDPDNQEKKSVQPRRKKKVAVIFCCVLAALLLVCGIGAAGVYFYLDNQISEGDAGQLTSEVVTTSPELTSKVMHYLICGIDYDDDRDYGNISKAKTDVILYLTLDVEAGKAYALQIPRDTYVGEEVPTGGTCKLNNVYSHGEDEENPISNLAKVINSHFGLPVDHYLTIDMASFRYLLNLIGGIEMYVPYEIKLKGSNEVVAEPGYQLVTGDLAELILRNRNFQQQDYKRLETQQYFYLALFNAFKANPQDFIKVAPSFIQYFNTDMSVADLLALANTAMNLEADEIGFVRAPGGPITRTDTVTGAAQSCYGINQTNMAELLNNYFRPYSDPVPAEELGLPVLTDADFTLGQNYEDIRTIGSLEPEQDASATADSSAAQ